MLDRCLDCDKHRTHVDGHRPVKVLQLEIIDRAGGEHSRVVDENASVILPYLKLIRDELAIPILYVTHSAAEVIALCEDVVVLQEGKCAAQGKPDDLFGLSDIRFYQLKGV